MITKLPIVYGLNDNYWFQTLVSSLSALKVAEKADLVFYYLVDGVTDGHRQIIRDYLNTAHSRVIFYDVDNSVFRGLPSWRGTMLTWARCALAETLIEERGWVCLCDGDTLWFKDPSFVFDEVKSIDASVVIAGSHSNSTAKGEIERLKKVGVCLRYEECFCMGFALAHVGKMREMKFLEMAKSYVRNFGPPQYLEQDVFNVLLQDRKILLPIGWGVYSHEGNLSRVKREDIGVVHYICDYPWTQSWRNGLSDIKKQWWIFSERMGLLKLDPQFTKKPLIYMIMTIIAKVYPVLPLFIRRRVCGEFVKFNFEG